MFEDENPLRAQQVALQHQFHHLFAALQVVGGVRKNHVELLGAALQGEERIGLHGIEVADAELCRRLPDKVVMHRVDLHRCDAPCSARGELVAYRPRPGKEVEHVALLEIHKVAQYVEQVFLGEIGRRACPQVARRVDGPPLVFSADYSHTIRLK